MTGMLTLILVGLVSGIITAISPCVLPVLPAILTSSVQEGAESKRRPVIVVAGLVTSFAVFTLLGGSLLGLLHLPQDVLRWVGIVVLAIVGLGLLIPAVGHLLEAPFTYTKMPKLNRNGNPFLMGVALGLVFVPCAGPILASITVLAATNGLSWGLVALTLSFSAGIAGPLLGFAVAGQAIAARIKTVRTRLATIRRVSGAVLVVTAVVIATNVLEPLQRLVPGVLADIQTSIEDNSKVRDELDSLAGRPEVASVPGQFSFDECAQDPTVLHDCGPARDIVGITSWLNTPGNAPLTLEELRGKVVLVDFWTYSCINCQRTLPYITAWNDRYKDDGLVIIGVHSPEFAFEHVEANVADAAARYGVTYPIALDNDFKTWRTWDQRFWPAHYLIDQQGTVRQVHYGEGAYDSTELLIQALLDAPATEVVQADPGDNTAGRSPESYLGSKRAMYRQNAQEPAADAPTAFTLADPVDRDRYSLGGTWTVAEEFARAESDGQLAYHFYASDVFLVLGGEGTVTVTRDGDPGYSKVVDVTGAPTLYTLYSGDATDDTLRLSFTDGVEAYAFTFG